MSKLLDFYTQILDAGSMIVDDAGTISAKVANATTPQSVGGKRLVLPTKEYMAKQDKSDVILFNPLHENIMRGESEIMVKFRGNANLKLNYSLQTLLGHLLVIASSTGLHSQLTPKNFDLIAIMKNVDEKTIESYKSMVKAMPLGNHDKCFVHIFIKKSAVVNGKNHRRGAIVLFPLYEEIVKAQSVNEAIVYGVKMRKRDLVVFKAVLEHLFPGIATPDSYSRGSISDMAPTLDCLLQAVMCLASGINGIVDDYGHIVEQLKDLRYEDEWVSELNDLEQFTVDLRLTPPQNGNEGTTAPAVQQFSPPAIQNVSHAPVQMPPVWAPPAPAWPQQPGYGQQPYMPPQGPAIVTTSTGKVDFAASIQRNPQLAAATVPPGQYGNQWQPQQPPGPVSNRQGVPAFARAPVSPMQGYGNGYGGYGAQPQYPQNGYSGLGGNL